MESMSQRDVVASNGKQWHACENNALRFRLLSFRSNMKRTNAFELRNENDACQDIGVSVLASLILPILIVHFKSKLIKIPFIQNYHQTAILCLLIISFVPLVPLPFSHQFVYTLMYRSE